MSDEKYIMCVDCRSTFTPEETKGWWVCPSCGSQGVAADTRENATITLTAHEWRILTIWADNWARRVCAKGSESQGAVHTIDAIIREMERQAPELDGLTMGKQIQEVADNLGVEVEQCSDGSTTIIKPAKRH